MYITVINKRTGKDIPFDILDNGEIKITSTNPIDDEDSCKVILSTLFYPNSLDYGKRYKRI